MSDTTIRTVRLKQIHREGAITVREDVHKKAFTKWLNSHLSKADPPIRVVDLIKDLSDGKVWLSLFDVLLDTKTAGRESGSSHVHNIYNLQKALEICQKNQIKIEGINASDIAEGNSKSILGLLWNIIVHFQMKGTLKAGSKDYSIEKNLQAWCLTQLDRYKEFVQVKDFSTSWRDGMAFNAVLHSYNPDLFDFTHILAMDNFSRLEHAFTLASLEWNVPRLLEPVDVDIEKPDKKMITMYLTCLYERLESANNSRDSGMRQSQREVSSTPSVSHQVVTTSSNTDEKATRQTKAFYLRKTSHSSVKSDKSDSSSQSDTSDFPRVHIEEKKSIRLSSVSSDISSSSSTSAEPLASPTATTLDKPEETVETATTIVEASAPENDLPRRVKYSEMYMLSPRSSDEDGSPLMSRRFVGETDSDGTSTDTVIHVETASGNKTTTTTTTTTRRIQLRGGLQGEEEREGETTTTTVIRETYMVEMPGEMRKRWTYGTGISESQEAEDKLSSECESVLETTEGLEKSFTVTEDQSKILEDKLTEAAIALSDLEPRVKMRESGKDVKELIEERNQLQFQVNQVLLTGRKMALDRVLDADKEAAMIEKLDKLERRLKLLMLWPIRDVRSVTNYDKLLDDKLKAVEAAVVHLEPKVKKSLVTRDIKALAKEREDLELKATVIVDVGRDLIRDKQIDQDKEKDIIKRMEQLEMNIQLIMLWPIKELNKLAFSSTSNYSTYLKQKLDEAESSVANIELRITKSYRNEDNTDLIRERSKLYLMVRGAVGLAHSMIEHRLLNYKEKKDFSQRIEKLEDNTNILMAWPIREDKRISHDRFLQNNLEEAESAVEEIEPRIDNADVYHDNTVLIEERNNLQVKTQAVIITGRGMSEDNLLDSKTEASFLDRLDRLEKRMNAIMDRPLDENNANFNHDIYLDKKIQETDISVNNMEERLRECFSSTDNTALAKERADLEVKIYGIVALGRGMIEDKKIEKKKENDLTIRLERLENRAKKMMRWPIRGLSSSEDRNKFLDGKLTDVETDTSNLEPRIRRKNKNAEEIKTLNAERDALDTKVYGIVSLGRAMIQDKLLDKKNEKHYQQRIDDVDRKMKMLMSWPITRLGGKEDYDKYFDDKLKKVETSLGNMEPRVRKSSSNKDNKALLKDVQDLDVQVYGTVSLGRAMMEDMLFSSKKEGEFQQRMEELEKKMKMLVMWPIKDTESGLAPPDHDDFLDKKLNEVNSDVTNFEPCLRKKSLSTADIKSLNSDRDALDTKVYGVVSLGRALIQDKLLDKKNEKHYQQRIDDVDRKMKMLMSWPITSFSDKEDYDKYFDDKLKKVETSVGNMEPRVRKSSSNKDNKALLKEVQDLDVQVYGTVSLGRAMMEDMLFSSKKEGEFQHRMQELEKKMKMLMMWPIKDTERSLLGRSDPDHDKFLDQKLNEVTTEVTDFEPLLRKKNHSAGEIKNLHSERHALDTKVYGIVSLGRAMIEDKLLDKKKEKYYQQRIDDVDRKMKMLMSWPIRRFSDKEDYDKYFDDKLKKVETSVGNMEPRVRKSSSNKDNKALLKEVQDLDVQVYGTVSLGRAMMEDMLFSSKKEGEFRHRMQKLEKKMKMLVMWPIKDTERSLLGRSDPDHDKFLDQKLNEVTTEVTNFEPLLRKKNHSAGEIKNLHSERHALDTKVYGIVSLGRAMIEDKLLDKKKEKYYQQRIDDVDRKMKMLMSWPITRLSGKEDYDKYFEDKLKKVETSVGNMESRVRKSSSNKDNKALLKEVQDLDVQVYGTVSLGRAMMEDMLFSSKKEGEFQHRMQELEKKMKMLMMWPIKDTESGLAPPDHDDFLEKKLNEVNSDVTNFEPRLRKKSLSTADMKSLNSDRDALDTKVYGVVSLGRALIQDKLLDKKNEKHYQQRIDDVDRKMKMLMSWPITSFSDKEDYDKYFDDKLKKVETSVGNMEPRVRKSSSNKDNKALLKEVQDLDVQVYGTVSLGRAMMEDMLFSSKKEGEFQHRMEELEKKMKMLVMWPIKDTERSLLGRSDPDHDNFLDQKLNEVTTEVTDFEPRLRKKNHSAGEIKNLHSERDALDTKVYGVVSLGRAMIEEKLIDKKNEKHYQQRIDDVDRKMKMLMSWPITRLSGKEDYDKYFEDKLKKVETSVGNMEPRVRKSRSNKDNKVLMNKLKDLDVQVYGTVSLGRAMMEDMLFSSKKEGEFRHRMEELEIKMKMIWQIGSVTRVPMSGRHKSFDANLRQMEITVSEFEERAKVKDRESVDLKSAKEGLDEIKLLVFERDQIELDAFGLLNEGRTMMGEEDIDQLDKDFYERRMNRLEDRVRVLREWLVNEMQRLFNIYIILIQQHLERLHDWLIRAEAKIDLEDDIAPTREGVMKQYDDHLEFHKEVGAYSTINMILEIDMDDPAVDDELRQDIKTTSERWAAVWNWSEQRKKHLADVVDDWEKFREEEERLFDWLCNKEDAINMIESTDISDAEEVVSHRSLLQSIILEMGAEEARLHVFLEAGELLIANAQYHNSTAKPIRDEMNDFDECWKTTLDRAQRHKSQLEDSRGTFLKLAELKKEVKTWLNDTEKLLSSANEERDENEQDNYLDKIRVKCEERELKQHHMDQINSLTKQLEPSIEDNSAQDINLVIKPLNRRWQDTSDRLDQYRDHERPFLHNDCWLVAYIKNALAAKKKRKEVQLE